MQITDKDLRQFRERAKTELQSNGAVGRLAWDAVVNALCNEVKKLRAMLDANIARVRHLEGMLGNAADAMLGCAIKQKESAPGNASSCAPMSLDEAIKHAEERADGSPCGQSHAQLAGWLRELRDLRNAPGNAAALREALKKIKKLNRYDLGCIRSKKRRDEFDARILEIERTVRAALAAPARNCDRFATEREAWEFYFAHTPDNGNILDGFPPWLYATEAVYGDAAPAEGGDHG